jgi:hypothetical protein
MLSTLPIQTLTHGVFWRPAQADANGPQGAQSGDVQGEWAYLSPSRPLGLSRLELRNALPHIQQETILFWFALNLRPYDLSGGPWFTFNSQNAGYGRAFLAPSPVSASEAIDREFGDILDPATGEAIAGERPGQWMWNGPPPQLPLQRDVGDAEFRQEVLRRLGAFERVLEQLSGAPAGVGHNSGEAAPLSREELDVAREAVAATRAQVAQAAAPENVARAWEPVRPILGKLVCWISSKVDLLASEAVKSIGQRSGELILVWMVLNAVQHGNVIEQLLRLILK